MNTFIISLNNGEAKKSISDVTDTHYTSVPDPKCKESVTVTGNRSMLRNFLEVKQVFSPILITPQHRIYLNRLNS